VPRGKQSDATVAWPSDPQVRPCSIGPQEEGLHSKTTLEQYDGGVKGVVSEPNGVADVGVYVSTVVEVSDGASAMVGRMYQLCRLKAMVQYLRKRVPRLNDQCDQRITHGSCLV
jgi:hypothetical protein